MLSKNGRTQIYRIEMLQRRPAGADKEIVSKEGSLLMEKRKFRHPTQFWSSDRNLTLLLVVLIFDKFILDPLVGVFNSGHAVIFMNSISFLIILLLGLLTLTQHKVTQLIFAVITVLIISARFSRLIFGETCLLIWDILLSIVFIIAFVLVLLINVYQEGHVTRHRILGAISAYLLIAMVFAYGYCLIEFLSPGAFHFPESVPRIVDLRMLRTTFNYFSISTLTTLGYGDVTPVHPFARSLTMMEGLIGQLYPVTLIARVVTLHITAGRTRNDN
ncbi:MAG: ion channel [Thermodesulfovibrionales bacterium]|jgi:hypothetical protein